MGDHGYGAVMLAILCVCNGRYYGGGFMPVGEAMPDDHIFDMLAWSQRSAGLTFFRLVGQYAKGQLPALSAV